MNKTEKEFSQWIDVNQNGFPSRPPGVSPELYYMVSLFFHLDIEAPTGSRSVKVLVPDYFSHKSLGVTYRDFCSLLKSPREIVFNYVLLRCYLNWLKFKVQFSFFLDVGEMSNEGNCGIILKEITHNNQLKFF